MEEVTLKGLEIHGKSFVLIETIDEYNFFVEETNFENICILKEEIKNGDTVYIDVDDDEFDQALNMYYEKFMKN